MHVGKKVLLLIAFFSFLYSLQAQNNWTVSVIDSFQTTNVGQGVFGLNSVVHDNTIHLTYFYHDNNSQTTLLYAVRNSGSFVVDTVAHIADFNSHEVSTSLQFNQDGSKWIYAGFYSYPNRIIGVFKQDGNEWNYTYIDETGDEKKIAAIQNNTEMGFAYVGKGKSINLQSIKYAQWNNDKWEITTISERNDTYKTTPSIIEAGGKIYLVFGEGRYPDSLIVRVYVKENQSWRLSFTDLMEIRYDGGGIGGLHTKIGVSNIGNPCIIHNLSDEVHLRYYELTEGSWQRRSINYPESTLLTKAICGSNILFDQENTLLTISQNNGYGSIISWIKENGDAGLADIPYSYIVWLQDFSILNNEVYVYYYDGYGAWPYDRPVTFKEAKIDITDLLTDVDESNTQLPQEFILYQNYPNPFNPVTNIKFSVPHTSYLNLKIYDFLGREVKTLLNNEVVAGLHSIQWNGTDNNGKKVASGIYIYKLNSNNFVTSKKLLLLK